jgi:hypothetical protein
LSSLFCKYLVGFCSVFDSESGALAQSRGLRGERFIYITARDDGGGKENCSPHIFNKTPHFCVDFYAPILFMNLASCFM